MAARVTAASRTAATVGGRLSGETARSASAFKARAAGSASAIGFAALGALLINVCSIGRPRPPAAGTSSRRSRPRLPGQCRHPVGARRHALADAAGRAVRDPDRYRRRDLPRGVRRPRRAGTTARSSSTSRTSRPCRRSSTASSDWRSSCAGRSASAVRSADRRADAVAAGAADRDHRLARGDPRGAAFDPRRRRSRSARPSGRRSAARCCRRRSPASRPARSSRSRGRSARRRR